MGAPDLLVVNDTRVLPAKLRGTKGTGVFGDDNAADNSTTPVAVSGGLAFASLSAGEDHNSAVTTGGAAYCWGWPSPGKLGDGSGRPQFTPAAVAAPAGGQ